MDLRNIGPYEVIGLLGEGGIGRVYAARDPVLGRQVAIKMLRPALSRDSGLVARFYAEAKSLANVTHPNITTLYALQSEGEEAFMVMELVPGHTLDALLSRVHRLGMGEALAVLAQTIAGLGNAHRMGVIHRDIKPSNLMVTDSGLLKIMDFGIARVRGSQHLTQVGEFAGTIAFASPEQIRSEEVDERSDIYSLGVVLYKMLAGGAPFAADSDYALMTAHLQTPPAPLTGRVPGLDERTESALMRALAKRPEDRFASVEEFGEAVGTDAIRGEATDILHHFVAAVFPPDSSNATRVIAHSEQSSKRNAAATSERPSGAVSQPATASPDRQPIANRRVVFALSAAVAALAVGLGYLLLWPHPTTAPPPSAEVTRVPTSEPAVPKAGVLELLVSPQDAQLRLDGKTMGIANGFHAEIEPGNHDVEIVAQGYESHDEMVTIPSGADQKLTIDLVKPDEAAARPPPPAAAVAAAPAARPLSAPQPAAPAEQTVAKYSGGEVFRDCPNCPEMLVVPAGKFQMGATMAEISRFPALPPRAGASEQPQHEVVIAKPFALAKFDVTRVEFAAFARATNFHAAANCQTVEDARSGQQINRSWEKPGFNQTDRDPVVCMSGIEIDAYLEWLRRETGKPYRLPTEAEWEYAARAGTTTAYYWGDDPNQVCMYENVADQTAKEKAGFARMVAMPCRDGFAETAPVGSFKPNPWGLYDMLGNVSVFTADCWNDSYAGAPTDGSAWATTGECGWRARRKASYGNGVRFVFRSANRSIGAWGVQRDRVGFRVALSLP